MISDLAFVNSIAYGLDQAQAAIENTQIQMITGKRITKASDDPAMWGEVRALTNANASAANDAAEASAALDRMSATQGAVSGIVDNLQQAIAIATEGSNGSLSPTDMQALAVQVGAILKQAISSANFRYNGAYVFGGTKTQTAAYDAAGNYQGSSAGNSEVFSSGLSVQMVFDGEQVFGDAASGTGTMAALSNLQTALASGNQASVSATLPELQQALTMASSFEAGLGGAETLLQNIHSEALTTSQQLNQNLSDMTNTDIGQAAVSMALERTQLQAMIGVASSLGKMSLVNVLA